LRFRTHSAFPRLWQRLLGWVCYFPTTSVFRFSQPPDAFIRPKPAGLISYRIRSWALPSKPSSSRAAAHCFQCLFPLDVFTSSGLCSTRESAILFSCLDCHRTRSSPGLSSLQGFPSCCTCLAFTIQPLLQLPFGRVRPTGSTLGFLSQQARLVSLETAYPLGILDLMIHHARSFHAKILGSPPKAPGVRHRPLISPSSNPALPCQSRAS